MTIRLADPADAARVDDVLRDLRLLGAEIAGYDFGYPVEEAVFEEGASASRIEQLASLAAEPLPADYRYFLSRCAGFVAMDFRNGYAMHTPELVMRMVRDPGAPRRLVAATGADTLLPVAGDGGGNVFLLRLGAATSILRWDHEIGATRLEVSSDDPSLTIVADSFAAFLERIRDDWRNFLGPDPDAWTYIT